MSEHPPTNAAYWKRRCKKLEAENATYTMALEIISTSSTTGHINSNQILTVHTLAREALTNSATTAKAIHEILITAEKYAKTEGWLDRPYLDHCGVPDCHACPLGLAVREYKKL